jgi:hypothetical protein
VSGPDPRGADRQCDGGRVDQGDQDVSGAHWWRIVGEVADAAGVRVIGRDGEGRPRAAWCLPPVAEIARRYAIGPTLAARVREAAEEIDHIRHPHGPGARSRSGERGPVRAVPSPGPDGPGTANRPDRGRRPGMGKGPLVARPQDGSRARANIAARSGTGPSAPGPGTGPSAPGPGTGPSAPGPGTGPHMIGPGTTRSADGPTADGRLSARQVEDLAALIHTALTATHALGMAEADDLAGRRVAGQMPADLAPERTAVRALWAALDNLRAAP